jgi:hypothetical protein
MEKLKRLSTTDDETVKIHILISNKEMEDRKKTI